MTATVREAFRFSAYLRQPSTISKEEKDAFVEEVTGSMQLEDRDNSSLLFIFIAILFNSLTFQAFAELASQIVGKNIAIRQSKFSLYRPAALTLSSMLADAPLNMAKIFVKAKGGTHQLLDNVFGYVAPGTLTALMSASGGGKTTLWTF